MSILNKFYNAKAIRFLFTALLLIAFIAGPLIGGTAQAAALPSIDASGAITPGLQDAIQEALGPGAFTPTKEAAKLSASDGAADDNFGWSVAISGDTALVGSVYDDDDDTSSGSAYIFERDQGGADNWGQVKKLTASDAFLGDEFGVSVALSGDTALVGAHLDNDINGDSGSVYIFERNQGGDGNWGEVKEITSSDNAEFDDFGWSLALEGDTALVGAYKDDDNGPNSGSVYIFERDAGGAGNWGEKIKLTASDGSEADYFGYAIALSGDTVLVGAYQEGDQTWSGSAYIFERDQGGVDNWGETVKLTASDGVTWDFFGRAVALSGDTALIGADGDGTDFIASDHGSAYLFERDQGGAGNWGQVKKITASDLAENDYFGSAVALSGDMALVGSYDADYGGSSDVGSAYIFERDQGGADNWGETAKLTPSDPNGGDRFGKAVALSGETALVGSRWDDDNGVNSGSAYVFTPYLANGGFEDPLGAEWTEIVSANGDGRIPLNQAYSGSFIYLFKADGGLEVIKQTVAQSGVAGDEYTLTLYFGGRNVNLSGKLGAKLIFKNGGVKVDKKTCIFTPSGSSFSWTSFSCTRTATGAFDSIEVFIGIQNVPSGLAGVDAAIMTKTGP